jgi:hypothetical protein
MKAVIVCGSRDADSAGWYDAVYGVLRIPAADLHEGNVLIEGDQKGIDRLAGGIGALIGWTVVVMPAQWERWGKAAGPTRNRDMLIVLQALQACGYEVAVLAFHDDIAHGSLGTKNMVDKARFARIPYAVYDHDGREKSYP